MKTTDSSWVSLPDVFEASFWATFVRHLPGYVESQPRGRILLSGTSAVRAFTAFSAAIGLKPATFASTSSWRAR